MSITLWRFDKEDTMSRLRFSAVGVAAVAAIVLSSCAGGLSARENPESAGIAAGPASVTVSLSTQAELEAVYGYTYAVNPFLPPPGIFTGGKSAFLVVRFQSDAPASLEIAGVDLAGADVAVKIQLLGKEELRRFWEGRLIDDGTQATDARNEKRYAVIDRYALNLDRATVLKKGSPYSLLIIGPKAAEIGTATLTVRYRVNGEYREQSFPVSFPEE
jgi:hypothetical protein